jgi:hypothetical protein
MTEEKSDGFITIRLIENAVLVKCGVGWLSFPDWEGRNGAAEHVAHRIKTLKKDRGEVIREGNYPLTT